MLDISPTRKGYALSTLLSLVLWSSPVFYVVAVPSVEYPDWDAPERAAAPLLIPAAIIGLAWLPIAYLIATVLRQFRILKAATFLGPVLLIYGIAFTYVAYNGDWEVPNSFGIWEIPALFTYLVAPPAFLWVWFSRSARLRHGVGN